MASLTNRNSVLDAGGWGREGHPNSACGSSSTPPRAEEGHLPCVALTQPHGENDGGCEDLLLAQIGELRWIPHIGFV